VRFNTDYEARSNPGFVSISVFKVESVDVFGSSIAEDHDAVIGSQVE